MSEKQIDVERVQQALADHDTLEAAREMTERLRATTDVTVWAKEWVSTAALIVARSNGDPLALLDEGWMIGWFANYAQTVNDFLHTQRVKDGVHPGLWHAFLHFFYMDNANAAIHTGSPRYSPITFRLAEFIMSEHGVQFAIDPDPRLSDVFNALGRYREDLGREAEDSLDSDTNVL